MIEILTEAATEPATALLNCLHASSNRVHKRRKYKEMLFLAMCTASSSNRGRKRKGNCIPERANGIWCMICHVCPKKAEGGNAERPL